VNVLIDASDMWCKWLVVRLSHVLSSLSGGLHDRRMVITLPY